MILKGFHPISRSLRGTEPLFALWQVDEVQQSAGEMTVSAEEALHGPGVDQAPSKSDRDLIDLDQVRYSRGRINMHGKYLHISEVATCFGAKIGQGSF